jgi:hypothetical protein
MGVFAAVRQAFLDAQYYAREWAYAQQKPSARARPAYNQALEALNSAQERKLLVVLEPGSAVLA